MGAVDRHEGASLTLRQPGRRLLGGVYGFLIVVWIFSWVSTGRGVSTWELGVRVMCIVLIAVAAVIVFAARLRADAVGVRSVNQFGRRRRLTWHEVHHFEARGYWRGLGAWTIDGRWVRLMQYGTYDRTAFVYLAKLEVFRWNQQQALRLV